VIGPWIRCGLAAAALVALGGWEPFRTADPDVSAGNAAYAEGRYDDALAAYDRAGRRGGVDPAGLAFDRGTAELKKADAVKDPAEKRGLTERALEDLKQAQRSRDPHVRAAASYNRGNALMARDKLDGAIEAYKDALRDDSTLDDARLNLELALRRRQKQQKQQQQGQGQGGQQGQQGQDQGQGQGQQGQGQGQGQGSNQQNEPSGQGSNQPPDGGNGQGSSPPQNGGNGQGSSPPQNGGNGQGSNAPGDAKPNGRPQRNRSNSRLPKTPSETKLDDLDDYSRRLQRDDARRRATGRSSDPQHDW
jgi:hypothetical protein